jgi:abhydrolase domain-containing protein 6
MTAALSERHVRVNGHPCRVWEQGQGRPLVFLPGIGGLPKWTPMLDLLAASRRVIAPSPPGFPGGLGHDELDTHFDWLLAIHDLIAAAAGPEVDAMAVSVSGALLADVAGVWPDLVARLVLVAPFGLFDPDEPSADIWAQRPGHLPQLLCRDQQTYKAFVEQPEGADPIEWKVEQMRAQEASARFLFPTGNTGLARRLGRIAQPTLLLRGSADAVIPASYLARMAAGLAGPVVQREIPGAGHLADLDAPQAVAEAVLAFLAR